ncbi:MAG: dockerin type I repeat-containing protein, partial [Coriobacteriales bacterium]|nr:dockerin type I repeat-containing protein [Coriobacteriales bacterium]
NLDASGVLNLAVGQSFDLDTFRVWQAPVGPVGYNFYEPDYSFELSGNSVAMERIGSEGRQQLRITALQPGTSVIKVSYGPIEVENQIGSVSRFNAIDPSAVGAVVIQVAGSGEIVVMGGDGGDGIAGIAGSVGEASAVISAAGSSFATGLSTDIDHDIFYFDQAEGSRTYTFTPASGTTVRVHNPLNISGWGTGWTAYTAAVDGSYTITLQSGRNIIELSQGGNVQYYLLRAKGVEVAVINSTNPGQPFALGDVALIQIRGIEEAIEKLCGVYNPGYGIPQYVSYTDGVSTVNSQNGVQYRSLTTTYSVNYTVTDLDAVLSGQYYMGMMAYEQRDVGWHRSIPLAGLLSAPDGWAIPKGPFAFGSLPEIHFAEAGEPEDPLVLQAAKDTRAALINAVLSGLVETDYTPQSWTALGAAVDAALTAVENATTVVEVEAVTVPDALSILVLKLAVGAPQSGDLNGDGIVDIAEALLIAQVVVGGGMTLSAEQFAAVDMDGDGLLTMADIVLMMRRAAGLP